MKHIIIERDYDAQVWRVKATNLANFPNNFESDFLDELLHRIPDEIERVQGSNYTPHDLTISVE